MCQFQTEYDLVYCVYYELQVKAIARDKSRRGRYHKPFGVTEKMKGVPHIFVTHDKKYICLLVMGPELAKSPKGSNMIFSSDHSLSGNPVKFCFMNKPAGLLG